MFQIPVPLLTLLAGILITLFSMWVGQHHNLMPEQASAQAPLVDEFFNILIAVATALFIVVEGIILIFAIKFRRRPGDDADGPPIEGSVPLEILWTAIPSIIVVILGIYSVDVYKDMGGVSFAGDHMSHTSANVHNIHNSNGSAIAATMSDASGISPQKNPVTPQIGIGATPESVSKPADLVVDVQGMQFAWIFNYPETGVTAGELHVPVGADVQLNLSATDVIHSFWVPQFRLKQDALPGIPTQLRFVATKPGRYPVVCAELCGGYHGSMRTQVIVHTPEGYDSWLKESIVAQKEEVKTTVAVNPVDLSPSEYLSPYTKDMGIEAATLAELSGN
ncbi:MAG: cytochrome c oxidase subunit II [Scytonematopsis contorta HA4267-MV1]|jgi:cytochrome c oxidase subunit 2|nr:cytochrome c oxidase subunit II [Scytonematopsis contorta HA4267-MV1]